MVFVAEDGLSIEVKVIVIGFEFLVVLDAFKGVDGLGDITELEWGVRSKALEEFEDDWLHDWKYFYKLFKFARANSLYLSTLRSYQIDNTYKFSSFHSIFKPSKIPHYIF